MADSKYFETLTELTQSRCETCHGIGTCDDAEPGDISIRKWPCKDCNATGFHNGDVKTLLFK